MKPIWIAVVSAALAPGALAQVTEETPEVVIVTGVGPDRTSDELIASTTVLDVDDIALRLSGGLGDTLSGLPGVSTTAFGPGASRPIIRGLGAERVQVLTNGLGVIDASAASPDHAVTGDPLGAERIEILRGAATLAYGGGASGGVVNVIDGVIVESRPSRLSTSQLYAGYTTVDTGLAVSARTMGVTENLVGVVTLSLKEAGDLRIPGSAESARLSAFEETRGDGHAEEAVQGRLENSFADSNALAAGLTYIADEGFIGAALRLNEARYGVVGGHAHEDEEGPSPFIEMSQARLDARGGLSLSYAGLRKVVVSVSAADYQHTEFEGPDAPGTVFSNSGYEARIEAEHGGVEGLDGSFGVQSVRRSFRADGGEAFIIPTVTRSQGVYIFEAFDTGRWGIEGGLRLDRTELETLSGAARSFETVNASFGVHQHVSDRLFVGLTASLTERAPTDVELFADGPHLATRQFELGDPDLGIEKGLSLEASGRWQAGALSLDASLYRFDFTDFIYLDPTGDERDGLPVFRAVQSDAVFTGGELTAGIDLGGALGFDWSTRLGLDAVRARLDAGGDLPRIPPAAATLGLEAETAGLKAALDVRWVAEQSKVALYELPTDSYVTLGAQVSFDLAQGVELILEGVNLTDEDVRIHASPVKDLAPMGGRGFRAALLAKF